MAAVCKASLVREFRILRQNRATHASTQRKHSEVCHSQKVLLSNRTYQDLRGYAHALRTSLRELVCDSLRGCVKCGCVVLVCVR